MFYYLLKIVINNKGNNIIESYIFIDKVGFLKVK